MVGYMNINDMDTSVLSEAFDVLHGAYDNDKQDLVLLVDKTSDTVRSVFDEIVAAHHDRNPEKIVDQITIWGLIVARRDEAGKLVTHDEYESNLFSKLFVGYGGMESILSVKVVLIDRPH